MAMPLPEEIRPLKRAEYNRLVQMGVFEGEHIELLEGQLIQMSPIGPLHASVVQKLTVLLVPLLRDRASVRIQSPFAALDTSEPEPDVAIVPLGDYEDEHPATALLIIEVAESSLRHDRGIKQRIYARAGVAEYWIVNTIEKCVEVYSQPAGDGYASCTTVDHGGSLAPQALVDVCFAVRQLMR